MLLEHPTKSAADLQQAEIGDRDRRRANNSYGQLLALAIGGTALLAIVNAAMGGSGIAFAIVVLLAALTIPYAVICVTHPVVAWATALTLTLFPEFYSRGDFAAYGPSDLAFGVLILARLISMLTARHGRTDKRIVPIVLAFYVLAGCYCVFAGLSSLYAIEPQLALKDALKWVEIIAIVWASVDLLTDLPNISLGALSYWFVWVAAVFGVLASRVPTWLSGNFPYLRSGGEEGSLAAIIAIAILLTDNSPRLKRGARVVLICAMIAIGASLTRQSVISAALAALTMIVVAARGRGSARRILGAAVFLVAATILTIILLPQQVRGDFATRILVADTASNLARKSLLHAASDMFLRHPFLGVGAGNFSANFRAYPHLGIAAQQVASIGPHNWFLNFAAETGVVGLALFISIVVVVTRAVWLGFRAPMPGWPQWPQLALVGIWIHWLVTVSLGDITGVLRLRLAATLGLVFSTYLVSRRRGTRLTPPTDSSTRLVATAVTEQPAGGQLHDAESAGSLSTDD